MENVNLKIVGERLQEKRKALHITQQAMADELNVTVFLISKIENGKTNSLNFSLLREICNHLNLDMSDVIRGSDPTGPEYLRDDIAVRLNKLDATQLETFVDILDVFIKHTK